MGYMDVEKAIKTAASMDYITPNDRLVWFVLAHHRNSKTGKCFPSIETIMKETGLSRSSVKRSKHSLEELGVLKVVEGGGRFSNNYHLLIHHVDKEQVRSFPVEDVDAVPETPVDGGGSERTGFSENPQPVQREPSGGSERTCSRFTENPESGSLTPEGNEGVNSAEAKAIASACADASAAWILPPHSGETGNDNIKDSGRPPNPQVSSVQSNVPIDALILDTPWEQEDEDALVAWRGTYGLPYDLADFLLIKVKFGQRIEAVLDGHGTLPLIIIWACHISRDFRKSLNVIESTTELRKEFPHILLKVTGYILKAELTPLMFKQRVEKAYVDNFTLGPTIGQPDPMDILEEAYMDYCDENEAVMTDMFNPWAEEDAAEAARPGYREEQLELQHQLRLMKERAIAELKSEEGEPFTGESGKIDDRGKPKQKLEDNRDVVAPELRGRIPAPPSAKNAIPTPIEDWIESATRPRASSSEDSQRQLQPRRDSIPDPSESSRDEGDSDNEAGDKVKKEPVALIDSKDVWKQLSGLIDVWKEVSDMNVSLVDFRHILRDHEPAMPQDYPVEYLAAVIRWTMAFWPKRGELKRGSMSFAGRFKEIQQDYFCEVSRVEAGEHKQIFVDPNEDL